MNGSNSSIIGTYKGKCCDAEVVNSNGMILNRELFDKLINSDEYKDALKNGYYIGFLGHPEDPDCQDFRNGCIVMTSMEMKDNGEIYGEFNLIDTPVGRTVKAFRDAGVQFGISIRGVGDLSDDGTVDPDTFVFRGFDLVSFPAYSDCVPEFHAIAASTDIEKRKKYQKICNTVKREASSITSSQSLEIIRDQFNENSEEYRELDGFVSDLKDSLGVIDQEDYISILEQKVEGLTNLYIEKVNENKCLYDDVCCLQKDIFNNSKVYKRAKNISASQINDITNELESLRSENSKLRKYKINASKIIKDYKETLDDLESKNGDLVYSNKDLKLKLETTVKANEELNNEINLLNKDNLKYKTEVKANKVTIKEQNSSIKSLESELNKTVVANERLTKETSNREDEIDELNSTIKANEQIILDYQQAYADMCAYSAGVKLENIPITSNTTVDELKSYIYGSASSFTASRSSADMSIDIDQFNEDSKDFVSDDTVVL